MKKLLFIIFLLSGICSAQTFDIAFIGDSYNKGIQYNADVDLLTKSIFQHSPLRQRRSQIAVYTASWKNRFQCSNSTAWDGSSCNWSKVYAALGSIPHDVIAVLVDRQDGGGATFGGAFVTGGKYHSDSLTGSIFRHELGHEFGFQEHSGGIMSATCNNGGCGYRQTYTPAQEDAINKILDDECGAFIDTEIPVLNILSPLFNQTYKAGQTVFVWATTSEDVMRTELLINEKSYQVQPLWERNSVANFTTGIRYYLTGLPIGTYKLTFISTDAAYNKITKSINITIQ